MARISDTTFRDWNNGEIMNEADYEKEREIIRTAINDNYDRLIKKYEVLNADGTVKSTQNLDTAINTIKFKQGSNIQFTLDATTSTLVMEVIQGAGSGLNAEYLNGNSVAYFATKSEHDTLTSRVSVNETNIANRYTKTETNNLLADKTDKTGDHGGTWQGYNPTDVGEAILSQRVNVLEAEHTEQDTSTTTHNRGISLINSDTDNPSPVKVEFYGQSRINHMGRQGGFHEQGKWDSNLVIDTSTYKFGTSSGKIDNSAGTTRKDSYNSQKQYLTGKYIIYGVWAKAVSGTPTIRASYVSHDSSGNPITESEYFDSVIDTNWKFYYQKFDLTSKTADHWLPRLSVVSYGTADDVAFFDGHVSIVVDSTTFSLTDADIQRLYPYVDSIKGLQNPSVKVNSGNLFDIHSVDLHANAELTDSKTITLIATGSYQKSSYNYDVVSGQSYVFTAGNQELGSYYYAEEFDGDGNKIRNAFSTIGDTGLVEEKFTTSVNAKSITVHATNDSTTGTFTFSNIMLNLGTTALPYTDYNPSYAYLEGTFYEGDNVYQVENDFYVSRENEALALDGTLEWSFVDDYSGFKRVKLTVQNAKNSTTNNTIVKKYNGSILETIDSSSANSGGDEVKISSGTLYITISDTDSGWGETYTPTQADIQAYFDANPYFLVYKLAEKVTEPVKYEGSLSISGDAHIEVGEGVVVREKANPVLYGSTYYLNDGNTVGGVDASKLNNRASKIIRIYKDGKEDNNWIIKSSLNAYGNEKAEIGKSLFDETATYTVTYEVLDKYAFTTHINSVKATYHNSLKSSVKAMQEDLTDALEKVSIHENTKANKHQENWIEPRLLNGWTTGNNYQLGYSKDDFGFVSLRGLITGGTKTVGTELFPLSKEYRPKQDVYIYTGTNGSGVVETQPIKISTDGYVTLHEKASLSWISFDGLKFRIY